MVTTTKNKYNVLEGFDLKQRLWLFIIDQTRLITFRLYFTVGKVKPHLKVICDQDNSSSLVGLVS